MRFSSHDGPCRTFFRVVILLGLTVFLLALPAGAKSLDELKKGAESGSVADQYALGKKYLRSRDYTNAKKWFLSAADKGYAAAQTKLGSMYEDGKGVKKDYGTAFTWYEKAALQGDGYAQRPLGKFYELGLGVDPDPKKAFYWYQKAAGQGIARAQANLGILYETGVGVEQNYEMALSWYRKSAKTGYPRGQYLVGKMYEEGLGVEQDLSLARQWYNKAAASKYSRAIKRLKVLGSVKKKEPAKKEKKQEKKIAKKKKEEPSGPAVVIKMKQREPVKAAEEKAPEKPPEVSVEEPPEKEPLPREQAVKLAQEHFFKGNNLVEQGKLDDAVVEYQSALKLDPGSANVLANLGITYFEMGRQKEGMKFLRDSITAKSNNAKTYSSLGMMLQAVKQDREALIEYQNAIKYNPAIADIYFFMAVIFTNLHDYDRAWKSLKMSDILGYKDTELRQILLSVSKEPEMVWPDDSRGIYLRQIVVPTRQKAEEIRQQLLGGGDFSALIESEGLEKYSENGGYMGYLEKGEISGNVWKMIKDLPPFAFSNILETEKGFHIFQRLMVLEELSDLVK